MSTHERAGLTRRGALVSGGAIAAGVALARTAAHTGNVEAAQEESAVGMGAFSRQSAIVTGAAHGIGRAIAVELAARGADVMAYDILEPIETYRAPASTEADMAETVRLVEATGRKAIPVKGDVRSLQELRAAVEQAVAEFGKVDMLVANAGIGGEALVGEMEEQVWQVTNERYLREVLFPDNPVPTAADVDAHAETFHTLPVGMLEPEDVARAVAFLLSDDARYLSGVVLDVAAGWNATWAA